MIDHIFLQACRIHTVTQNEYGDDIVTGSVSSFCRFRSITSLNTYGSREDIQSDGIVWLPTTANIQNGSLISVDGDDYRITRITLARRLGSPDVLFKKCMVERISGLVS